MLLYFNNEGKLISKLPHGEVPRQGGDLNLWVLFEKDYDLTNKTMKVRYRVNNSVKFDPEYVMDRLKSYYTFTSITGETNNSNVFENGKEYDGFYVSLSNSNANKIYGNLRLVFTLYKVNSSNVITETVVEGAVDVYVEETLGLSSDAGLGMTITEYNTLMNNIASLNANKADKTSLTQEITTKKLTANEISVSTLSATNVAGNFNASNLSLTGKLKSNLLPDETDTRNLGHANNRYKNVFAKAYNGDEITVSRGYFKTIQPIENENLNIGTETKPVHNINMDNELFFRNSNNYGKIQFGNSDITNDADGFHIRTASGVDQHFYTKNNYNYDWNVYRGSQSLIKSYKSTRANEGDEIVAPISFFTDTLQPLYISRAFLDGNTYNNPTVTGETNFNGNVKVNNKKFDITGNTTTSFFSVNGGYSSIEATNSSVSISGNTVSLTASGTQPVTANKFKVTGNADLTSSEIGSLTVTGSGYFNGNVDSNNNNSMVKLGTVKTMIADQFSQTIDRTHVEKDFVSGTYTLHFYHNNGDGTETELTGLKTTWDTPDEYIIDTTKTPESEPKYDADGNYIGTQIKIYLYGGISFTFMVNSIIFESGSTSSDVVQINISGNKISATPNQTFLNVANNESVRQANETERIANDTARNSYFNELKSAIYASNGRVSILNVIDDDYSSGITLTELSLPETNVEL